MVNAGHEFLYESTTTSGTTSMASGHGKPWTTDGQGAVRRLSLHTSSQGRAFFVPGLLLLHSIVDSTVSLKLIGSDYVNGVTAIHVRTVESYAGQTLPSTQEDWYFDPNTYLPLEYGYLLMSQQAENYLLHVKVQYTGFQSFGLLVEPARLTFSFDGVPQPSDCSLSAVATNTSPLSSVFDAPGGGAQ